MQIITTEVAAETLGITPQRVRQLIRELGIEVQTIGKAMILTPADLKLLEKRKTQRGPTKGKKS